MKIEMWADIMCPLCYVGKTYVEDAVEQFERTVDTKVTRSYKTFQLFPDAPSHTGKNYYDWTANNHGGDITPSFVKKANAEIAKMASKVGLTYNLDTLQPSNTTEALRTVIFARERGLASELMSQLYKAYWTDSLDIGDHATLAKLAANVGLDELEVLNMLAGDQYKDTLRQERQYGMQLGITGTPFYIINDKYTISGIRPTEFLFEVLSQVWQEEHPLQMIDTGSQGDSEGGICGDVCKA